MHNQGRYSLSSYTLKSVFDTLQPTHFPSLPLSHTHMAAHRGDIVSKLKRFFQFTGFKGSNEKKKGSP